VDTVILDSSDPVRSLWVEQVKHRGPFAFTFGENGAQNGNHIEPLLAKEAPELADSLVARGLAVGASDLHLEPTGRSLSVRQRRDGMLESLTTLPDELGRALVSCLKIRSGLDIAEKRRPQDGRMTFQHGSRGVDIRVSTMPTQFGEKLVLRLLDGSNSLSTFDDLGMLERDRVVVEQALAVPDGLFLLTGPTGSGKTTTLYAMLRYLAAPEVNIQTIEDPIEYRLPGINQSQVKPEINYTFATALRSFLRQDPDIIMVGEIRDAETLSVAIRAALTGHRVLSTLHTNDAPSAVARLVDLGGEPFLLAATLRLLVAQRLLRRRCGCDGQVDCPRCGGSELSGRIGLFECMRVDRDAAALIAKGADIQMLRDHARAHDMRTLREDGVEKCRLGLTIEAEVERVVA
jgi:type II secretory ATPase GspE/PulE/Tfp pilus assembly ATPase PilB-like protein